MYRIVQYIKMKHRLLKIHLRRRGIIRLNVLPTTSNDFKKLKKSELRYFPVQGVVIFS